MSRAPRTTPGYDHEHFDTPGPGIILLWFAAGGAGVAGSWFHIGAVYGIVGMALLYFAVLMLLERSKADQHLILQRDLPCNGECQGELGYRAHG